MIHIEPIPALKDNYIWCIIQPTYKNCIIVDPGESAPVTVFLKQHNLHLEAILITHHHADHTAGVPSLCQQHTHIPVFGPESCKDVTHPVHSGTFNPTPWLSQLEVLKIPGHTLDHIAYHQAEYTFVMCGDTLFAGGCGRVFEGTPQLMLNALQTLAALPDATKVFCAHEYTLKNLEFAITIEPYNTDLQKRLTHVREQRRQQYITLPSTIALEKTTNPFLRCHIPAIAKTLELPSNCSTCDVFTMLRRKKDNF